MRGGGPLIVNHLRFYYWAHSAVENVDCGPVLLLKCWVVPSRGSISCFWGNCWLLAAERERCRAVCDILSPLSSHRSWIYKYNVYCTVFTHHQWWQIGMEKIIWTVFFITTSDLSKTDMLNFERHCLMASLTWKSLMENIWSDMVGHCQVIVRSSSPHASISAVTVHDVISW